MCGIAGVHRYRSGVAQSVPAVELMCDRMATRGPDAAGIWTSADGRTIFGHRRLSIIDLTPAGNQPMQDGDGLTIVFNGEIYNYAELRAGLLARGYRFQTSSDTEVLLHLWREYGEGMLAKLRGMFAFAIHDSHRAVLFLARDPFGIKPLYYSDDSDQLVFASSVKALSGAVGFAVSDVGLAGYLMTGSVPEPFTIAQNIRALPAGHCMTVQNGERPSPRSWYRLADKFAGADTTSGRLSRQELAEALTDSVMAHMVADIPVGLFLSAGIDSTLLLGLQRQLGFENVCTITAQFREFSGGDADESYLAAHTAAHFGSQHITRLIDRDEFETDRHDFFAAMDQPTIDGVNIWFVAKAAKEQGLKACLSGLGADELFGGYSSFVDVPRWNRQAGMLGGGEWREAAARLLSRSLPAGLVHAKAYALLGQAKDLTGSWLVRRGLFTPWDVERLLGRERARAALAELDLTTQLSDAIADGPVSDFGKIIVLESAFYMRNQLLRDSDWAGMAHSVEVRVPFVDSVLFERLAPRLATHHKPGKGVLTSVLETQFPQAVAGRPKTGFQTPVHQWMGAAGGNGGGDRSRRSVLKGHSSRRWAWTVMQQMGLVEPENGTERAAND